MSIKVIVADSGKARILSAETSKGLLTESEDLIHSASRLREQDLVADRVGSESEESGYGRHSMGHEKQSHNKEAAVFAGELGKEVKKMSEAEKIHRIYLVAPPKFLGMLRSAIHKPIANLIVAELDKNLVNHSLEDIRAHLPKLL